MTNQPEPPAHLRSPTAEWWASVLKEYTLEPHHVRLLTLAAEAFDRCAQAREAVDADGITIKTGDGGLKAHPAVAIERDSRLAFARLLRELDLDVEPPRHPTDGRRLSAAIGGTMPVNRRTSKVRDHRVTPEAVEAYRAGDSRALHHALRLRPWIPSPLDVCPDQSSPWPEGSGGATGWTLALELRAELETGITK